MQFAVGDGDPVDLGLEKGAEHGVKVLSLEHRGLSRHQPAGTAAMPPEPDWRCLTSRLETTARNALLPSATRWSMTSACCQK